MADLVERALPGVECQLARPCSSEYAPTWLELTLIGSAGDLVRHGVVTAQMISSLPPSGVRRYEHGAFGTEASALVARTAGGDYRVNVRSFEDGAAAPIVWRFGIDAPAEIRARPQRRLRLVVDNTRKSAS